MKTIGIVGGVGPYAGLDLAKKIFDQTKASADQDHLPVSLLSIPHGIADRTAFLLGKTEENPGIFIAEVIKQLAAGGAVVVGIPCNTAHAAPIFGEVLRRIPPEINLLNMIKETAQYLKSQFPDVKNAGLLATTGTMKSQVYDAYLPKEGIQIVRVSEAMQAQDIHPAIYHQEYGIKARSNPVTDFARNELIGGIEALIQKGAQAIILGCTELPLAFREDHYNGVPLIDPTAILARALIENFSPAHLK